MPLEVNTVMEKDPPAEIDSKATADPGAVTVKTCPAEPRDVSPVPPFVVGIVSRRSLLNVPVATLAAFKFVRLAPEIFAIVPAKFAAGRFVKLAPEPEKVVAVATPFE